MLPPLVGKVQQLLSSCTRCDSSTSASLQISPPLNTNEMIGCWDPNGYMLTQHKPRESFVGTYLLHQASVAQQVKILAATAGDVGDSGDMGLIPGLGRSHRGGNGNSLQYSCLENPMDRGARLATVYRVTKSQTHTPQLLTMLFAPPSALPDYFVLPCFINIKVVHPHLVISFYTLGCGPGTADSEVNRWSFLTLKIPHSSARDML